MADIAVLRQFLQVCGLSNAGGNPKTRQFITSTSLTSINSFLHFDPSQAETLMKQHNDNPDIQSRITMTEMMGIQALIFWVRDRTRRGLDLNIGEWTEQELNRCLDELRMNKQRKDEPDSQKVFNHCKCDGVLGWFDCHDKF
jgi:hypothetical protein